MASRTQSKTSLSYLNAGRQTYPTSPETARIEAFDNPNPGRDYWIELDCPEFTALCPITGQPDFGHLVIRYIPDRLCVESKSLKLYLFAYRNHGAFHEAVTNRILDDLVHAIQPRKMMITGSFNRRGGIAIKIEATYSEEDGI